MTTVSSNILFGTLLTERFIISVLQHWQSVATNVRHQRDQLREQIKPRLQQQLTQIPESKQQYILSLTATQLVHHISHNKLTSTDIMIVYCNRALQLGELLGSNATELFEQAIDTAAQQDNQRQQKRKQLNLPSNARVQ